ncbi:MAG TPA: hypothetical protein VF770_08060 [Solirubrobacterales bacterium]
MRSHIELGKAEAEAIKGEIAYAAAFVGIAIAVLLLLGIFLPIGLMLFAGEWLFGSIGWGLLLGTELLLAIALTGVITALRLDGAAAAVGVAVIAGVVTFIVLGASWPYLLWQRLADTLNLAVDPTVRIWLTAVIAVGAIGALVGLLLGARVGGIGGAIAGIIGGAILGALIGAFLAYDFGWRVGAALGIAVALAAYMGVRGARVASQGVDTETIKLRFWPQQTIDTTRETIEWAKSRNPLAPKS